MVVVNLDGVSSPVDKSEIIEAVRAENKRIITEMKRLGKFREDEEVNCYDFEAGVFYYEDDAYSGRVIKYTFHPYYNDCLVETIDSDSPEQLAGWNIVSINYKDKWYIINNIADRACPVIYKDKVYLCELDRDTFRDYAICVTPAMYEGEEERYEVETRNYNIDCDEVNKLLNMESTKDFTEYMVKLFTEQYENMDIITLKNLDLILHDEQ